MAKPVTRIIAPREKDLGGFSVQRILPVAQQRKVGPWIFFDHMGPANFSAGEGINVRPHPHVNLATVTYLFEGEVLHRDSLGSYQTILPGDINLMVTGSGMTHSERTRDEVKAQPHCQHGLQLWLAMPEEMEECEPAFHHYPSGQIPTTNIGGVPVRVMIGTAHGVTSPVRQLARTLYTEAKLKAGQHYPIPHEEERAIYIVNGRASIAGEAILANHMAVLGGADGLVLSAEEDTQIALIGGEPLGERHIFWNFVSSSQERIEKAKRDWAKGNFPKVPGDEEEFIPLPE